MSRRFFGHVAVVAVLCMPAFAGDATVVLYRPNDTTKGSWSAATISIDGNEICKIRRSQFVSLSLSPGSHKIMDGDYELEGGGTYFFELRVDQRLFRGTWRARLVPDKEGQRWKKASKRISCGREVSKPAEQPAAMGDTLL
jgi:hypothetical protein